MLQKRVSVWAHRGMGLLSAQKYQIPPNSLAAFKWSTDLGLNGFETDVCLTTDDEPIIYHPGTLDPNPCLESWIATQWHQPEVLHLKDLISFLSSNSINCLLDIKQNSNLLVEKIITEVNEAKLYDRIFLTTPSQQIKFAGLTTDSKLLIHAKTIDPKIRIHVIDVLPYSILRTAKQFNADIISFGWLNDSRISKILFDMFFYKKMLRQCIHKSLGLKILAGITKTRKEIQHVFDCLEETVDGIITDNPEEVLEFLNTNPG